MNGGRRHAVAVLFFSLRVVRHSAIQNQMLVCRPTAKLIRDFHFHFILFQIAGSSNPMLACRDAVLAVDINRVRIPLWQSIHHEISHSPSVVIFHHPHYSSNIEAVVTRKGRKWGQIVLIDIAL